MKYLVTIEEKLVKKVIVDAKTEDEAEDLVADAYYDEYIVLDSNSFNDRAKFTVEKASKDDVSCYDNLREYLDD